MEQQPWGCNSEVGCMLSNPMILSSIFSREKRVEEEKRKLNSNYIPCTPSQRGKWLFHSYYHRPWCWQIIASRNQSSAFPLGFLTIESEAINENSFLLSSFLYLESLFPLPSQVFRFCPAFSTGPSSLCFRKPLTTDFFFTQVTSELNPHTQKSRVENSQIWEWHTSCYIPLWKISVT